MRPRRTSPHPTYCLLSLGDARVDQSAFAVRTGRLGGAVGTAIATHVLLVLLVWALAGLQPGVQPSTSARPALASLVYVASGADGGGSSRGGNQTPEPPARHWTRGAEVMAVAAAAAPSVATPDSIAPEREPSPALPVTPMDAGDLPQVGVVDGVPGPPTDGRGPGDGGVGTRPGNRGGLGDGEGDDIGDGPYPIGNGVSPPQLLHRTSPQYTPEAMRAKIQGVALLSGVVGADGTLREIRVARSLDGTFGLDREAIRCVRQWRFRPGTRQGTPVAVYVTIEVAFNLR